jgi:hypothetical protein
MEVVLDVYPDVCRGYQGAIGIHIEVWVNVVAFLFVVKASYFHGVDVVYDLVCGLFLIYFWGLAYYLG